MKNVGRNIGKILVDARALITIILGLGGMFGWEVQESNSKIVKLQEQAVTIQAQADKYKKMYEDFTKTSDGVKKDIDSVTEDGKKTINDIKEIFGK